MKKSHGLLALIPLMFILSGCPVGITYPLGFPGTEKIEKDLIGTWIQSDTALEVIKMKIEKLDDFSYKLTVLERGTSYMEETDVFKGWCTAINKQQFVYFQTFDDANSEYYHYAYKFDGKKLITYDMSLLDGGTDAVTSTQTFREQVTTSMTKPEFLSSEIIWNKN